MAAGSPLPIEPSGVVFDLDGCLSDAAPAIVGSHLAACGALGLAWPGRGRIEAMIGPPLADAVDVLLAELGVAPDRHARMAEAYIDIYRGDYVDRSVAEAACPPGVAAVVARLAAAQMPLAVATSKPRRFAVPILDALGLRAHFAVIEGPDADAGAEPKRITLRRALAGLASSVGADGFDPSGVVMVGDRHHDIDAAHANGCAAIGVTWGHAAPGELAAADAVAESAAALARLLGLAPV